jgi:hypothetical protein
VSEHEHEQDGSDLPLFYHPLTHSQGQEPPRTLGERARGSAGAKSRDSYDSRTRKIRIDQVVDDLTQLAPALHLMPQ